MGRHRLCPALRLFVCGGLSRYRGEFLFGVGCGGRGLILLKGGGQFLLCRFGGGPILRGFRLYRGRSGLFRFFHGRCGGFRCRRRGRRSFGQGRQPGIGKGAVMRFGFGRFPRFFRFHFRCGDWDWSNAGIGGGNFLRTGGSRRGELFGGYSRSFGCRHRCFCRRGCSRRNSRFLGNGDFLGNQGFPGNRSSGGGSRFSLRFRLTGGGGRVLRQCGFLLHRESRRSFFFPFGGTVIAEVRRTTVFPAAFRLCGGGAFFGNTVFGAAIRGCLPRGRLSDGTGGFPAAGAETTAPAAGGPASGGSGQLLLLNLGQHLLSGSNGDLPPHGDGLFPEIVLIPKIHHAVKAVIPADDDKIGILVLGD